MSAPSLDDLNLFGDQPQGIDEPMTSDFAPIGPKQDAPMPATPIATGRAVPGLVMGKDDPTYTPSSTERQTIAANAGFLQTRAPIGYGQSGDAPVNPATLAFAQPGAGGPGDQPPALPRPQMVAAQNVSLVDPRLRQQQGAALEQQRDAVTGQQDAQTALGRAEATSLQQQAQAERQQGAEGRQYAADENSRAEADAAKADQAAARRDQIAADVAKDHEDPERWWHSQSTFNQVRFALADALGGFAQGFGHLAENPVDTIARHTAADVHAQEQDFKNHQNKLDQANNAYADLLKRLGNRREATKAYHSMLLDGAAHEAKAMAIESGSPTAIAKADLIAQQLEERKAQLSREGIDKQVSESKYIPAHLAMPAAQKVFDPKEQHELSKERDEAGIPAFEAQEKRARALIAANGGEVPGSGFISRNLPESFAGLRGTEARQFDGAITSMAEAMAHANGQRGTESIMLNKKIIMGNGSNEDIQAGLARAHDVIQARAKEIAAGHDALQNQVHRIGVQLSDDEEGGAAPTPQGFSE